MLDLTKEIEKIIKNDPWLKESIDKRWYKHHSDKSPEWYEDIAFKFPWRNENDEYEEKSLELIEWSWVIYADCLREFGIVIFTQDLTTGTSYLESTRQTIKTLIEQYGLRNVTNEIAKQVKEMEKICSK